MISRAVGDETQSRSAFLIQFGPRNRYAMIYRGNDAKLRETEASASRNYVDI